MATEERSQEQAEKLTRFIDAVRASPHNLVSAAAREELETRHLPECVALAHLLPRADGPQRLLDVGSGGGFPGIVIAAVRDDLQVTLLESRAKKTEFLRSIAEALELQVTVLRGRAEDVARTDHADSYHLVTARAVAPLHRLLSWTLPFLRPGGLLYAVKGERWQQELDEARPELERLRGRVIAVPSDLAHMVPNAPRTVIVSRTS